MWQIHVALNNSLVNRGRNKSKHINKEKSLQRDSRETPERSQLELETCPHLIFSFLVVLCAEQRLCLSRTSQWTRKQVQRGRGGDKGGKEPTGDGRVVIAEQEKVKDKPEQKIKGGLRGPDSTVFTTTLSLQTQECRGEYKKEVAST